MQFIFGSFAGKKSISISTKEYGHIFKVRRVKLGDRLCFRNLDDDFLYTYQIEEISKKEASLKLIASENKAVLPHKELHIAWCIVDPKIIEKYLAMLNEMGVTSLGLIYADFSQKNYKIDRERIQRILLNSSQQCGRSNLLHVEYFNSIHEYITAYPDTAVIDFCDKYLECGTEHKRFLVGPEGGFSKNERDLLAKNESYGLKPFSILRSESAVLGVCAKLIL